MYEMGEARGLLDGQHRVGALKMLAESEVLMPEAHLILVEVFPVLQQEDVKRCVALRVVLVLVLVFFWCKCRYGMLTGWNASCQHTAAAAHRLFIEVNNAQPVSLIDMPDMANVQEKVIITEAAEILRMEYPNMFKVRVCSLGSRRRGAIRGPAIHLSFLCSLPTYPSTQNRCRPTAGSRT